MVARESVVEALRECYDPEIPLSIVDLGLVYDISIAGGAVKVKMTMTSPGCPLHASMAEMVRQRLQKLEGVTVAEVEVVWQPPWTPERMSPEARKRLGWS